MTPMNSELPQKGDIKLHPHTNPDGSEVKVTLIALEGKWPNADIRSSVTIGNGVVITGHVSSVGLNTRIGNNVILGDCGIEKADIGDNVTVLGTEQNRSLLMGCTILHHATVHGRFGSGVVIGAHSSVYGSFTLGRVGEKSKVFLNKHWDEYCLDTVRRLDVGDGSIVDMVQQAGERLLDTLTVGNGSEVYLGGIGGDFVTIGDKVRIGHDANQRCNLKDIIISDGVSIFGNYTLDENCLVLTEGPCTIAMFSDGDLMMWGNSSRIDKNEALRKLAAATAQRIQAMTRRAERAEGRYVALGKKLRAFADDISHELTPPKG